MHYGPDFTRERPHDSGSADPQKDWHKLEATRQF